MPTKKSLSLVVSSALFLTGSIAAHAAVEEVLVTAQKRDESVQEIPIAITALSAEMLESSGVSTPTELGQITPGFTGVSGSGYFVPYIRGVGARAITPGNESPTATYVDGVYMTDKGGVLLFGFNDIESIAVLRGPQGTLFGRNATAGAVTITTRRPSQTLGGKLELTYGSDVQAGNLFVTGGLTDTVSASVSAFFKNQDPYIDNINPNNDFGDTGDSEASGVRAKLLWEPTDTFSALLSMDYVDDWDSSYDAVQAVKEAGPVTAENPALGGIPDIREKRVYAGDIPPKTWHRGQGASLTLNWDLEKFSIKSITAYREDMGGIDLDLDASPLPLFYFQTELSGRTVQQEITLSSNLDGPFSWVAGAYYVDYHDGYNALDKFAGLSYPFNPAQLGSRGPTSGSARITDRTFVDVESAALYGDVGYEITDSTSIKLGLRYTDETHTMDDNNKSITYVGNGAGGIITAATVYTRDVCAATPTCDGMDTSFEEFTYRAVLEQKFGYDTLAYASYNRGFKSGVYNISTITNTSATDPEIVDAYELGVKTSMLDNTLQLNLAVYYNEYKNMQVAVTSASNTQFAINAAKAETSGLEAEAKWQASDNFNLQAGFSTFFTAEYKSFENCDTYGVALSGYGNRSIGGADCSGKQLPGTPDYTAYIAGDYTIPFEAGSRIVVGGTLSYQDDFNVASVTDDPRVVNAPDIVGYETLNMYATWYAPNDEYYLKLFGNNLTDQDPYLGMFTTTFGFESTYARGRNWGVTVGKNF